MTQYYSRIDAALNGDVYNIPFSYMKESEISVYINDEPITAWEFLNESQIKINEMPSEIPADAIVSIRRITDITEKAVDYSNQSMLSKESLNLSQDQLLNAVQEIYDNNIIWEGATVDLIEANKQEMLSLQNDFEEHINTTFADVNNAAAKLNELETSVATAVDAASSATSANQNAQTAAQEAQAAATSANQNAQTAAQAAAQQAANKVSKTGDTMTGTLTIAMVTPTQAFRSTDIAINDSTATTVAHIPFLDKNYNPFGSIGLIHQPTTGNYFSINPRDESGVAMTQPFLVGRGSAGDFFSFPMATTTPTTTSTARTNLISAVVANYRNGNTWYIKFSDNFKIQGGYATQTGDGYVTLPLTLGALFAGVSTQVNSIANNDGARICNPRGTGFDYNSPSPFYWVVYGW